jgi:hypothetical protein
METFYMILVNQHCFLDRLGAEMPVMTVIKQDTWAYTMIIGFQTPLSAEQ